MAAKTYTIIRHGLRSESTYTGTVAELTEKFGYTLERGRSYERERGNHRINLHPTTARALVNNLNWAVDNAAANGCGSDCYELVG